MQYLQSHTCRLTPQEERDLYHQALKDETARQKLILSPLHMIADAVKRIFPDRQSQEDVLTETLFQISRGWQTWKGNSRFSTWAFRIATNVALQLLKTQKRRKEIELTDYVAAYTRGPEDVAAAARQSIKRLAELVTKLPVQQREVLSIGYFGKVILSYEVAARQLGIGEEAYKSRLYRARRNLQRLCREEGLTLPGED